MKITPAEHKIIAQAIECGTIISISKKDYEFRVCHTWGSGIGSHAIIYDIGKSWDAINSEIGVLEKKLCTKSIPAKGPAQCADGHWLGSKEHPCG